MVCLADKPRECLRIGHVVQRQVSTNNLVSIGVYRKGSFSPDAAFFLTMLFHLPLILSEDF